MNVNSTDNIQQRVAAGKITWTGILIMLVARSVLAVVSQASVATIFFANSTDGWNEAGEWFRVYGTIIDLGSIALLAWLAHREGIHLFDLGNYSRKHWRRDILIGLGLFIAVFPLAMVLPEILASSAVYGGPAPRSIGVMPMAGFLYSLIIWPAIWAFAEDNTYFGYLLPRLEVLTGRTWLAVVILVFFGTFQHIFMPFTLDSQYFMYRFVGSILISIVFSLLYLRYRRLMPIHIIHWLGNAISILMFMFMPVAGG